MTTAAPIRPLLRLDPDVLERARRSLRRRDPALGKVIRAVGPCRMQSHGDPYAALLRSVLFQQLAGAAAKAIERRVKDHFGGRWPRPDALLAATPAQLRGLGLSRQKAATLQGIARAFAEKELSSYRLRRMEDAAVVEAVTTIKGIGEWTAHMLLMFSLRRPDVLPVGDYGVRKGAQLLYRLEDLPKPKELEALGERWRPYRSVAAWYLWRATETITPEG